MKYFLYILFSASLDKYYIGTTNNIERRIYEHNLGRGKYTSKGIPWEIKFTRFFNSKDDAVKEERRLKKCKSRKYIESYITAQLVEHPDL